MIAECAQAMADAVADVQGLSESLPSPQDKVNAPAFHLSLAGIDYGLAINQGGARCTWMAGVIVSRTALAAQYAALETFLDPDGTVYTSIVKALRADPTFAGTVDGSTVGSVASIQAIESPDGTAYILATVEVETWT